MTQQPGRAAAAGRLLALLVTNAIKIGGLYVAIHTAATEATPNVVLIGEACFMMAGAQLSEDAILRMVARMFGASSHDDPHHRNGGPS